jgi:hypothetical protein
MLDSKRWTLSYSVLLDRPELKPDKHWNARSSVAYTSIVGGSTADCHMPPITCIHTPDIFNQTYTLIHQQKKHVIVLNNLPNYIQSNS